MYTFEMNKIAGAILFTLLMVLVLQNLASIIYTPENVHVNAYVPEGVDEEVTTATVEEEEPLSVLLANASVSDGEKVSRKCISCHTFEQGGPNRVGPNLYNIVGAKKAHLENFNYSSAMEEAVGEWSYQELFNYLENPRQYIPGNKMAFIGIRDDQDRADLIAFLTSKTENPPPFPEPPAEEAGEGAEPAQEGAEAPLNGEEAGEAAE